MPAGAHRPDSPATRAWLNAKLGVARGWILAGISWFMVRWRRSLQLRVAVTTMAVTVVVVLVVGFILLSQIADGLTSAKQQTAIAQSSGGVRYVESQVNVVTDLSGPNLRDVLSRTAKELRQRASTAGLFEVVLVSVDRGQDEVAPTGPGIDAVPSDLRALVAGGSQAYRNVVVEDTDGVRKTMLVVGSLVPTEAGHFELYYLFPLTQEETTLALIQRTVIFSGLALVLLVASIGLLMTRLVVQPVRSAAQTAERLAAGRLEERMVVRGEDDLARLATSFNDMAVSLQRQINQLEELSRLQQRFTSDVSHELRTPLTTVRMAADVLYDAREDFPAASARSAELLQTELGRFESLLVDLLEISRYDAGVTVLETEQTDLVELVQRVVDHSLGVASRQGCDIVLRTPHEPVYAEVDPRRVERVLRNLLANAVEHGEGMPVQITVVGDDNSVAVGIRDHGVGIDVGDLEQVFNRFWRADPSRQRKLGGTGLGLSISREDARLHGGWLDAWGVQGQGASFRLTLPRRPGEVLTDSPLSLVPDDVVDAPMDSIDGIDVVGSVTVVEPIEPDDLDAEGSETSRIETVGLDAVDLEDAVDPRDAVDRNAEDTVAGGPR